MEAIGVIFDLTNPDKSGFPLRYDRSTSPTSFTFDICNQKEYDCT